MKPTSAQIGLLEKLEKGYEVTLLEGYYTIVNKTGEEVERIWPTTFHGLFMSGAVERAESGNYIISEDGRSIIGG